MTDRILKAMASAVSGLMALLYVLHNIANVGPAYEFFVYTTSHVDQAAYPVTLLPVPPAILIVVAMVVVFALEMAAGLLGLYGAWKIFAARDADAATFLAAKKWAKIGAGCAVLNWWGLFQGVAVAGYQLWQMPLGEGPFYGSFFFGTIAMASLIYISMPEERVAA
ncbi:DUF2165 family protein [Croceicoccus bisphenolivorans]|uniref:DUF2165 family protein n=1 Tax=Croceicoccus bisphenolivorans TaxID=1783232 RepID=UPI000834C744|nr:DUF2165 family protein [Croceicoccus bisphenolivorans]